MGPCTHPIGCMPHADTVAPSSAVWQPRGCAGVCIEPYVLSPSGGLRAVRVAARADGLLGFLADAPRGLAHGHKLLGRRRVDAHYGIQLRLGYAHLHRHRKALAHHDNRVC